MLCMAGSVLVGGTKIDKGGAGEAHNDNSSTYLLVPIPPKNLPQHILDEKNAEGDRVYFWHHLVGILPQPHSLLHCFPCKPFYLGYDDLFCRVHSFVPLCVHSFRNYIHRLLGVAGMFLRFNEWLHALGSGVIIRKVPAISDCHAQRRYATSFYCQRAQPEILVQLVTQQQPWWGSHCAWMWMDHSVLEYTNGLSPSSLAALLLSRFFIPSSGDSWL